MRLGRSVRWLAVVATLTVSGCTLARPADPVVVSGAQVAGLQSVAAGDLVAFRWADGWRQVPIQVDERKLVDLGAVYNSSPTGVVVTAYADAGTFTGADPDPDVDANDEIAFMAQDVGGKAPSTAPPAGVVPGSGIELRVVSTLGGKTREGRVYLFERSGALDPAAGRSYVEYDFNLLSGSYKTTYRLQDGPNPENSTVTTPYYVHHFSDRWLNDQLKVTAPGASGTDILDRAKARLIPGNCGRSEDTFDDAEGAFIANRTGPVRAIRSYVGANSGPLTQREHIFYERRQDIRTFLRVHAIPGVVDYFDYSAAASGMTYKHSADADGVRIDGVPDAISPGQIAWESVDGSQGGLSIVHTLATDIPGFTTTSYYLDDSTPSETQCTGDAAAYGASGPWVNHSIPNTDPTSTPFNRLLATRTIYYEKPGNANGAARSAQVASDFGVTATAWP
jgi:hypothetical protein